MSGSHSVATSKATMSDSQIALWRERLENPPQKAKTIPGPAMTLKGSRKQHPKAPEKPVTGHAHHWLIETPDGATCEGRCKTCGATKSFVTCPEEMFTNFTKAER